MQIVLERHENVRGSRHVIPGEDHLIFHHEGTDVDLIPWNAFCREKSVVNQRE